MIRDLTKSMLSFSWAMSLFGVEQLTNTLIPQRPKPAKPQGNDRFQRGDTSDRRAAQRRAQGGF